VSRFGQNIDGKSDRAVAFTPALVWGSLVNADTNSVDIRPVGRGV
jgi:hypothetical protein